MSALYSVKTGTTVTALVAGTGKTLVNLISGANRIPLITQFAISFDGVTASAVPVLVEPSYCTQGAAGTPGTSPTPSLLRGKGASQSTAGVDYSAEPTTITPYDHMLVTPNGGLFVLQFPLGREPEADLSGGTNKAQLIRGTAPANVNCRASAQFEE
jgi:hypothetical protein